jgi:hypothetical protein
MNTNNIFAYYLNTDAKLDATLAYKTDYKSTIIVEIARLDGSVLETRHFEDGNAADRFAQRAIRR